VSSSYCLLIASHSKYFSIQMCSSVLFSFNSRMSETFSQIDVCSDYFSHSLFILQSSSDHALSSVSKRVMRHLTHTIEVVLCTECQSLETRSITVFNSEYLYLTLLSI